MRTTVIKGEWETYWFFWMRRRVSTYVEDDDSELMLVKHTWEYSRQ